MYIIRPWDDLGTNRTGTLAVAASVVLLFVVFMPAIMNALRGVAGTDEASWVPWFDAAFRWLSWGLSIPLALACIYLWFAVFRNINLNLEWMGRESKTELFTSTVDDLAADEKMSQFSEAERLRLGVKLEVRWRCTIRSWIEGRRMAKQLAEQRGILNDYLAASTPKVSAKEIAEWDRRARKRDLQNRG